MKRIITILLGVSCMVGAVFAEDESVQLANSSVTYGVLQGGGSLFGVDYEKKIGKRWAYQVGAGLLGVGAGINYHLSEDISSSFIHTGVWNQNIAGDYHQRVVGVTYGFRNKSKGFVGQFGVGYVFSRGDGATEMLESKFGTVPDVIAMYSLGWVNVK